jgi:hypothetical protein
MSEFSTEGFESFPSLYADNKRTAELSEWTIQMLEERASQYVAFLQRDDLMPRAKAQADRMLDHMLFELQYRDGLYNEVPRAEEVREHI